MVAIRSFLLPSLVFLVLVQAALSAKSRNKSNRGLTWWSLAEDFTFPPPNTQTNDIYPIPRSVYEMKRSDPSLRLLTKKQKRIAMHDSGSIVAVAKASREAIRECRRQFSQRHWNCPTEPLEMVAPSGTYVTGGGENTYGKLVQISCRETAFVYAITSAALTHAVAQACSEQIITTCSCEQRKDDTEREGWIWGGCSDNIKFATKFAKKFVTDSSKQGGSEESATGTSAHLRAMLNRHNNEAGRKNVQEIATKVCSCQGTSGSCTLKTCWNRLPSFRKIGDALKARFDGASQVKTGVPVVAREKESTRSKRPGFRPVSPAHKPPRRSDLVYTQESPDFCGAESDKYGVPAPLGRECNATSSGIDGCELLCCGRGFREDTYISAVRCNCSFEWCCDVKCDLCHSQLTRHICK